MSTHSYEHSTCPICNQPLEVICTERGYGVTVDDRGEISDGWHSKDFSAEREITCPNDHEENEMHALWNGDDLHPLIKLDPEATAALEVKVNAQDNDEIDNALDEAGAQLQADRIDAGLTPTEDK
jgi:hypothetical protein